MDRRVLLVGSSGFLGQSLALRLKSNGLLVDTLDRRDVDLSKSVPSSLLELLKRGNYQCMIFCAAVTDVEKCYQDPLLSTQINVTRTIALLDLAQQACILPVFFSSDYVFGNEPNLHREEDPRTPQTQYGRQKLAVENYLESNFDDYLIFRTSKLMSKTAHPKNILLPILRALSTNRPMRCFTDQWLNPVFVEDIAEVISMALEQRLHGTYHLGTRRVFTRFELGKFLASSLGLNPDLIGEISLNELHFSEIRPTHNTLDCSKIENALSFHFTEIEPAIHDLRRLY